MPTEENLGFCNYMLKEYYIPGNTGTMFLSTVLFGFKSILIIMKMKAKAHTI